MRVYLPGVGCVWDVQDVVRPILLDRELVTNPRKEEACTGAGRRDGSQYFV
jgi:hypothetical protein